MLDAIRTSRCFMCERDFAVDPPKSPLSGWTCADCSAILKAVRRRRRKLDKKTCPTCGRPRSGKAA